MGHSRAGIRTFALATKGTLTTTPTNVVVGGLRKSGKLEILPLNELKTQLNQFIPNLTNFKFESTTFQAMLTTLSNLHNLVLNGCDAQLITVPQTSGSLSSGGVFNFVGDNYPGLGFEFVISKDERSAKIMLEVGVEDHQRDELLTQSLANTPLDLSAYGNGLSVKDCSKYVSPAFISAKYNSQDVFAKDELMDYKLTIKTKSTGKSAYNRDRNNYYSVIFEITGTDARISKLQSEYGLGRCLSLELKQRFDPDTNDVFEFEPGVLHKREETTIGDDDRFLKVIYEADIPVGDVTFGDLEGSDPHKITFNG